MGGVISLILYKFVTGKKTNYLTIVISHGNKK